MFLKCSMLWLKCLMFK